MDGRAVTASRGELTRCTRDQDYGSFTVSGDMVAHDFGFTADAARSCWYQPGRQTWELSMPGGSGRVEMNGPIDPRPRCRPDG
jgi:hypothetical protein